MRSKYIVAGFLESSTTICWRVYIEHESMLTKLIHRVHEHVCETRKSDANACLREYVECKIRFSRFLDQARGHVVEIYTSSARAY